MQFTQGLHRAVQMQPDAIATVHGERQKTFAQLADRVARLAAGYAQLGLQPGDRVCILCLNSDRYLESYLALAWAGLVVNPANFRWSPPEVIYSIDDSLCKALIVDDHFGKDAQEIMDGCDSLQHLIFAGDGDGDGPAGATKHEALVNDNDPAADREVGGDELFGIFYTGGTTGRPKGVMLTHTSICTAALSLLAEGCFAGRGATCLHAAPMFHLADMMNTTCSVIRGAKHVFCPAFKPDAVLSLVQDNGVTDLLLVPAMLQAMVAFPGTAEADTSCVQRVLYGASPASETLLDAVMQAFPNAGLLQVYGMTENSAVSTVLPPYQHTQEGRAAGNKLQSGGRAALHTAVRIVDDNDQELPRGTAGEIIVRGPGLMKGYLNKPEATAEALKNGWMHTGDMGVMDEDGFVSVVDRKKDMIITGGENVYSAEVENAASKHPAVAQVAVIGIPHEEMGEQVHACVVLKEGAELTQEDLYAHCKTMIAGYKSPRSLSTHDARPLSGAGKVLKTELRKPHWEGRERGVN